MKEIIDEITKAYERISGSEVTSEIIDGERVIFRISNRNAAPTIKLENLKEFADMTYERLEEVLVNTLKEMEGINGSLLTDRNFALENVREWVAPASYLDKYFGEKEMDLARLFYVDCKKAGIDGRIKITPELAETYGVTCEDLKEASKKNFDFKMLNFGMPPMIVLTNQEKSHGANVILHNEVLSELLGEEEEYYLIPSSIHELIALPAGSLEPDEVDKFADYIRDVNASDAVGADEILSDHLYIWKDGTVAMI